jgi:site-specific DNA-adenine methylase
MRKMLKLGDVLFKCEDYSAVVIPGNSMVYCDIPYRGRTGYDYCGKFDHDRFYDFVRDNSKEHDIFISGYEGDVPDDFKVVWKHTSKQDIRSNGNTRKRTVEILMQYERWHIHSII